MSSCQTKKSEKLQKSSCWIIITKWKFQIFFLDDSCDMWHDLRNKICQGMLPDSLCFDPKPPKNTFWTKGNPVIYTLENKHGTQKSRSSSNDDPFQLADVELFFLIFSCISTLPSRMGHVEKSQGTIQTQIHWARFLTMKKGLIPKSSTELQTKVRTSGDSDVFKTGWGEKRHDTLTGGVVFVVSILRLWIFVFGLSWR